MQVSRNLQLPLALPSLFYYFCHRQQQQSHCQHHTHCQRQGHYDCRYQILLGEWKKTDRSEAAEAQRLRIDIEDNHIHPRFNEVLLDNDFVLLKLSRRVPLEAYPHIRPICLPRPGEDVKGKAAIVAGWGSIDDGHSNIADVLLQANLTIMSNSDCLLDSKYPPHELTENMLCAKSPVGESVQDACQGDSGGPLIAWTGSEYSLVGVVSWGYGCGVAEYPGVFARVTKVYL